MRIARGISRHGSLISSASGAAPSNPPNARIVYTEPAITPVRPWNCPAGVYFVVNTLNVLLLPAWTMKDREHDEDADLEHAEDGAQPRRRADAVEAGREHDHRAEQRPRPPQVRRVPVELRVQGGSGGESELEQHQRRDQEPDQDVPPGHQEADGGGQGARPVGGHPSRRGGPPPPHPPAPPPEQGRPPRAEH